MTLDPRQSVEFEPVAIGRRRRRIDPAVIGVGVVTVALALAVLKPWGGDTTDPARLADATSPSPSTEASVRPAATDGPIPATVVAARPALSWADLETVIGVHEAWGIQALLRAPGRTTISERWSPVRERPDDDPLAVVQPGERSVVGLGVTYPLGHAPLDVRIWRRSSTGALNWVDARAIARDPAQGGLIFVPPWSDPGAPAWGAGEYRLDLLLGSGDIRRIDVAIPDRYENVRPSSFDPARVTELVTTSAADPTSVRPGLFATIDHVALAIEGAGGPALDESAAWLDTEPGSGRIPADRVAVATMPRATGLGVRLADGSRVRSASIERLAPGRFRTAPTRVGGGVIDRRDADPWVLFAARRGDAWAPGVYRIDVTWSDAAGLHESAWHIELRPGPTTGPSSLLALARGWARHAGTAGLVVGRAEPLEGGPRSSAIRRLDLVDEEVASEAPPPDAWCRGTVVDGTPAAFGLAHPVDDPWTITDVWWVDATLRGMGDLATVQATEVVPGLILIAPADGESFVPGLYRIGVQGREGERTYSVCVGLAAGAGG